MFMTFYPFLLLIIIVSHTIPIYQASCGSKQYYHKLTATCEACDSSCSTCFGPSTNHCSSCQSGMTLSNNNCLCSSGDFFHTQSQKCKGCNNQCSASCTGPSKGECSNCNSSQFSYQSSCHTLCTATQYFDTGLLSCQPCHPDCYSCIGPGNNQCTTNTSAETVVGAPICDVSCLTCSGNQANQCLSCSSATNLVNGTCVSPYSGSCDSSCLTCSGSSASDCLSCQSNQTLSNGSCVIICDSSCLTCSGNQANQCLSCSGSDQLANGQCIAPYSGQCDSTCLTCSGSSASDCLSCQSNKTLANASCVASGNSSGATCDPACLTCSGNQSNQCLSCSSGKNLVNGTCISPYTGPCDFSCLTCSGSSATDCLSCQTNLTMANGSCVTVCDPSCLTCSGIQANQCLSCSSSDKLVNGECIPPYSGPCDLTCLSCSGSSASDCLSCQANQSLVNGSCLAQSISTLSCHSSCNTCENSSEIGCTSCANNNFFLEISQGVGSCYSKCPDGYFESVINNIKICKAQLNVKVHSAGTADKKTFIIGFDIDIKKIYNSLVSQLSATIQTQQSQVDISYSYSFSLSDSHQQIILQLKFNSYIPPSSTLIVTLPNSLSVGSTVYIFDKTQSTFALQEYYEYSDSTKSFISAVSSISQTFSQANGVYSIISSTAFKSLHSIRSELIDSMLNFFVLMKVQFPPNFIDFAAGNMQASDTIMPSMLNNLVPNLNRDDQDPATQTTFDLYLPGRSFFVNYGNNLSLIIILLILIIALDAILKLTTMKFSSQHKLTKILSHANFSVKWNSVISEFISGYQESTLYSMLGLKAALSATDAFGAGLILIITTLGMVLIFVFERKVSASEKQSEEKHSTLFRRLAILHESLKPEKFRNLLYFNFLLLRSFGFSLCLIFAEEIPSLQLTYLCLTTIAFMAYLVIVRPIKKNSQLVVTMLYEVLLLSATVITCILHAYNQHHVDDIATRSNMGFALIVIGLGMTVINIGNFFIELYEFRESFRRKKKVHVLPLDSPRIVENDQKTLKPLRLLNPTDDNILMSLRLTKDGWPLSPKSDEASDVEIVRPLNKGLDRSESRSSNSKTSDRFHNISNNLLQPNSGNLLLKIPSESKNFEGGFPMFDQDGLSPSMVSFSGLLTPGTRRSNRSNRPFLLSGFKSQEKEDFSDLEVTKRESAGEGRDSATARPDSENNSKSLLETDNLHRTLKRIRNRQIRVSIMNNNFHDIGIEDYDNTPITPIKLILPDIASTPKSRILNRSKRDDTM